MAHIYPSILITDIRGKAGSAVFSAWKGRNYVKKWVIPANPETPDRRAQKNRLKKVVQWWHDVTNDFRAYLKVLAQETTVSGFNLFTRDNVHALYLAQPAPMMTLSNQLEAPQSFAASTGPTSKLIAITWSAPTPDPQDPYAGLEAYVEPTACPAGVSQLETPDVSGYNPEDESGLITCLNAATAYRVWLMFVKTSGAYSLAATATATSHA